MRADVIDLEEKFSMELASDRSDGHRRILLDADALGNMRFEFINSLGGKAARGILERIGYRCGRNYARKLYERQQWPSDEEWFRAGFTMHDLEGMAQVLLNRIDIDRAGKKLHVAGEWRDSYEAEHHLQQYGIGSRSVCWILEGYATGFACEVFGGETICLETHCRGKGDSTCRFEIRPAAEWENSIHPIQQTTLAVQFTEFKSLEKQLANAEHLATLGELSAGLAHEIRNPLAGIKGAIDVIRDSLPASNIHREILGDVIHEVNRIDKTVRDLLNYAKPKPPSYSPINISDIAHRIAAMVRTTIKNDSLTIEVNSSGVIPEFTGDAIQVEQVLLNLLLNARNAMPSGGHISIDLSYDSEMSTIRIIVQDNGPGIPEEIKNRIFQPFFTTRTDGIGLGLATCLKNVQYHGGTIEAFSEMGRGATFAVTIPLLCHI
jgi:predicted hydrocarbon binding protein/two-component sensor histidine kinase